MTLAEDDIVTDFMGRLFQLQPDFPQPIAAELERQIRANWAGAQPYIAAHPNAQRIARYRAALAAIEAGEPPAAAIRSHGVSKATLYRLLKQRANANR